MTLKLKQLPDREMRKLTITLSPDIFRDLEAYAEIYEKTYGNREQTGDLVGPIIETFLASDSGFKKARKEHQSRT